MSWAGFSAGGGRGGAGFGFSHTSGAGRGHFSSGYARSFGAGVGATTAASSSIGGTGVGWGGGAQVQSAGSSTANAGTETPRVAVIGTGEAMFRQWWPMHTGGLRVTVVVGTADAQPSHAADSTNSTSPVTTVTRRRAAAEAARAAAARCVEFHQLPSSRRPLTAGASPPPPAVGVRVCVSEDAADEATATAAATTATATTAAAPARAPEKDDIVATAWSWFLKPFLEPQSSAAAVKTGSGGTASASGAGYWSSRAGATSPSSAVGAAAGAGSGGRGATALVDEVEVVCLLDYGAECDEAGVRAALLWLLERGKHLVVECALSADTLASCAAAAASTVRGRPEMRRLFLYRGGGCRRGWSSTAMAELRKAIGVRRAVSTPVHTTATTTTTTTTASSGGGGGGVVATTVAKTVAPAEESDGGFSVFDLLGSTLGDAVKDTSDGTAASSAKSSAAATPATTATPHPTSSTAKETEGSGASPGAAPPSPPPPPPTPPSLAVGEAGSVVGVARRVGLVVIGSGGSLPVSAASMGVMGSLGWDAVAAVLQLLDWTCPDMVVGRVLRRSAEARQPLTVQAEMYYGLEEAATAAVGAAAAPGVAPTRPAYLCVSLYVAATESTELRVLDDHDDDTDDSRTFQQSLRVVGTRSVLTVHHPLLPGPPAAGGAAPGTTPATTPAAPRVLHRYSVATQDAAAASGQRERREHVVTVGAAEPCAECRLWQRVRAQLSVTAAAAPLGGGAGFGGGYQPYGARYANRGGGYYGRGARGRGTGFGGGLGIGAVSAAAPTTSSAPSLKAELTAGEAAALDVQHAWLIQTVVERILDSAATQSP
ncbi:hypothetical protein NESM_000343300 [Novymonas esmeraldas]|uniref:Uncharacterized protein n=1 Tax=Novymonas esmeraldas TaxID=1808958 RepID=A0AAW0EN40_9TRYP